MKLVLLFPQTTFKPTNFDENALKTETRFFTKQIDPNFPVWFSGETLLNEIEDETDFVQYG